VNKLSRVFVALAVSASTIVVPHALAQRTTPPPSDAKLMHDVEAVLQNEKAFRGLSIVPKTSRGIVTLTGSVSSEGDKVLAGLEVGNVDGVKTVINNLEVKASASTEGHLPALANPSGAQTQQLSTEARTYPTPAAAPGAPLERKTAKANDHFHGTVATVVFADGALAIPVGTPVVGRVVSAKPAGHFIAEANMSLEITTLRLPLLDGKSRDVPVVTEYLTNNGQAHGSNVAPSGQIEVKPQTVLRFQTQAALTTSVWIKNGTQLQLPAAQDPILDSRPSSN